MQRHLDVLFRGLARRQTALIPYWNLFKLQADREVVFAASEIRRVVEGLIADARRDVAEYSEIREHPRSLLEAFVASHERGESDLSDEEIIGNLLTLLLAGEDTTANTISWMAFFLAEYPSVQARLQEEVDRVFGPDEIEWTDRTDISAKLPYLQAVANETLRCKPVGGEMFHEPLEDVEIMGVHVPRGTPILALTGMPAMREDYVARPDEFLPERWLGGGGSSLGPSNPKAFMPFGTGPRSCPGRLLASLEINMVVTMLCQDFEICRTNDMPSPRSEYAIAVGPDRVDVILRPRRAARFGVELESREAERRRMVQSIRFPNRRSSERRSSGGALP